MGNNGGKQSQTNKGLLREIDKETKKINRKLKTLKEEYNQENAKIPNIELSIGVIEKKLRDSETLSTAVNDPEYKAMVDKETGQLAELNKIKEKNRKKIKYIEDRRKNLERQVKDNKSITNFLMHSIRETELNDLILEYVKGIKPTRKQLDTIYNLQTEHRRLGRRHRGGRGQIINQLLKRNGIKPPI